MVRLALSEGELSLQADENEAMLMYLSEIESVIREANIGLCKLRMNSTTKCIQISPLTQHR